MRKRKTVICLMFLLLTLSLSVQASEETGGGQNAETPAKPAPEKEPSSPKPIEKKLKKEKWYKVGTHRIYIKKNGKRAVGSCKIKGRYYIFNEKGYLVRPKKKKLVTVKGAAYCVGKKGYAVSGWNIINGKLYYSKKNGKVKKNTTVQGITLTRTGAAKNNIYTKSKIKAIQVYRSITSESMSKSRKLRACWNYMTGGRFYYSSKYPNLNQKGWQRSTAYNMLTTHSGNCYSYACAFAALAAEAGYKPYVVCGRVSGSRDGAADGLTRHAWVRINGCYYDPEAQALGWYRGVYGSGGYYVRHSIQRFVEY